MLVVCLKKSRKLTLYIGKSWSDVKLWILVLNNEHKIFRYVERLIEYLETELVDVSKVQFGNCIRIKDIQDSTKKWIELTHNIKKNTLFIADLNNSMEAYTKTYYIPRKKLLSYTEEELERFTTNKIYSSCGYKDEIYIVQPVMI